MCTIVSALEAAAEAGGLWLQRLDKKAERALVFAQRKALEGAVNEAGDGAALLAAGVPLLVIKHMGRCICVVAWAHGGGVGLGHDCAMIPCPCCLCFHPQLVCALYSMPSWSVLCICKSERCFLRGGFKGRRPFCPFSEVAF
jgi:hypothetical protein